MQAPFSRLATLMILALALPACAVKKAKPLAEASGAPESGSDDHFEVEVAATERGPLTDPRSQLMVERLVIAKTPLLGKSLAPKVGFAVTGDADYVAWELCPRQSGVACQEGTTMLNQFFLGVLSAGAYALTVKACVAAERAPTATNACSQAAYSEWTQEGGGELAANLLRGELLAKEAELQSYGPRLHGILANFQAGLKSCQGELAGSEHEAAVIRELETQLENVLNLGPEFLAFGLQGLEPDSQGGKEQLASTLQAEFIAPSPAPLYQRGGLSLAASRQQRWQALQKYFAGQVVRYRGEGRLLNQKGIDAVILANSGRSQRRASLGLAGGVVVPMSQAGFTALNSRQQYAVMAGVILLAGAAIIGPEAARDFAGFTALNALFTGESSKLNTRCLAMDRAQGELAAVKARVRAIKERLRELAATQGN